MPRPASQFDQFVGGRLDSIELPIDGIVFEPPRQSTNREAVESLARRISETGIPTPICVYFRMGETTPYAIDGFELKEAVELAKGQGWLPESQTISVIARLDRELSQQLTVITNRLLSKEASQIVRADCIRELVDLNHPLKTIAKTLRVQRSYCNRLLALSFSTAEIRSAIAQKRLSMTTAMNVLVKHGSTEGGQLLFSAIEAAERLGQKATGSFVAQYIRQQFGEYLADADEGESPEAINQDHTKLADQLKGADSFSIGIAVQGEQEIRSLLDRLFKAGEALQLSLTMHYARLPEELVEALMPNFNGLNVQLRNEEPES